MTQRSSLFARSAATSSSSRVRRTPLIKKVITLSEGKAPLSKYGKLCHKEPVVVTVNGVPSFQLEPLDEEDDLIDKLLEYNPRFREELESRLGERSVTVAEAARR